MSRSPPHEAGRQDQGVVAPATAVLLAVLVGMVGLVTDVGVWFYQRRDLQAATDAAALAASPNATSAATAQATAISVLAANGYPASVLQATETGYYCQDSTLAAGARFQTTRCTSDPVSAPANAVRLTTRTTAPLILSRAVLGAAASAKTIGVKATAARINQAGMEAGTGTADLNVGMVNAALSSLTGGSGVNLTLVQYQGLATAHVDALELLDALAVKANVGAGAYSQVLASSLSVGDILDAAAQVMAAHPEVANATTAVAGLQAIRAQVTGSPQVSLGQLIDLGIWENLKVGRASDAPSALHAGLNIYQLATFSLQLANQQNAVAIPDTTLGVPGLTSLTIQATAIEPPTKAYFSFGPAGASVHTASARVKLSLNIAQLQALGILSTGVQVPLYIEVAGGDATLSSIACYGAPATDTQVVVQARGGLTDIWIGAPATNLMTNFSNAITPADIQAVPILNLGLLNVLATNVSAKGHVAVGSSSSALTQLTFVQPTGTVTTGGTPTTTGYIGRSAKDSRGFSAPIPARAYSQNIGSGMMDGLAETLEVNTKSCLTVPLVGTVCLVDITLTGSGVGQLFTVLDPILTALDEPVDVLLRSLGLTVGYIDVFVTGVRCGAPVLVN